VAVRRRRSAPKAEELALLRLLALAGADRAPVVVSSREIGEKLGVSQQAADNYLVRLAGTGLLSRALGGRKQQLSLTPAALELLRREYHAYRRIFEGPGHLRMRGHVVSGLGEGRYYLSQPGYVVQFAERLGYTPYPGTLNVKLGGEDLVRLRAIKDWSGTRIDPFEASGRTFGGAKCVASRLNGRACHLIMPDRTHHQDIAEFISPEFLRGALSVQDLDPVDIELQES